MNMALLLQNFRDAVKEGDGERIITCIKMFLLHFKQDGRAAPSMLWRLCSTCFKI